MFSLFSRHLYLVRSIYFLNIGYKDLDRIKSYFCIRNNINNLTFHSLVVDDLNLRL